MDRQQILDIILKHIRNNVDGLEDAQIDVGQSMASYGATSLDIVEVVSAAKQELEIRVARTELADLKNIGELADLFFKIKNQGR